MNKADKTLEELGFVKKLCYGGFKFIHNEDINNIKIFQFDFMPENKLYIHGEINQKELQAIFEISKELGWLDNGED